MKQVYTLLILLSSAILIAQAPQSFSYQAVVRDATGDIIASSPVSLRISILAGSPQGQAVFEETHFITTNQFGLIAVNIGQGTTTLGMFDTISWNSGIYFIQTELDATGGANYIMMGATQILSVPYALYGRDEDYDTINEMQTISYQNDTLSISGRNKIYLPIGFLGEVRMIALSLAGADGLAYINSKGWAICDGSSPVSQGISDALISETPDLSHKFIRGSNSTTSGGGGGSESHNHQWLGEGGVDFNRPLTREAVNARTHSWDSNGDKRKLSELDGYYNSFLANAYTTLVETIPPYYELVFIIKVK